MKKVRLQSLTLPILLSSFAFIPHKEVIIGGQNIGFGLKADGVIVSGSYDLKTSRGIYNPTSDSDIKKGDIIYEIEGSEVKSISDLNSSIQEISEDEVTLGIKRHDSKIMRKLRVYEIDGKYKTGLYVKERVLGIGTLTYYDPDTKTYGALGHEVKETGDKPLDITSGLIYDSEVIGIKKSQDGKVGEKVATLDETKVLGDVIKNTEYGIYGHMEKPLGSKTYKLAKASEVKKGKATVYTVLDGSKMEPFTIEITSLKDPTYISTKGISFKITDPKVLKRTNGVISGMSGSPIVQGDYLVGALTHIMVDDCDRGYGVYIEHMFSMLSS